MATFGKMMRTGAAAALLLAGISTGVQAFSGTGGGATGIGGGGRFPLRFTGRIVCTNCSLDEARKAQPNAYHLYQLTYKRGQAVVEVSTVNNSVRWGALTWPPQLWVRAEDKVFQQLIAEENLSKEIEITGVLSNSHTLDVFDVAIHG